MIGLVALIIFGPRKLPEIARTIGKFMAEFRRSTDDFKKTWEREADAAKEYLAEFKPDNLIESAKNSISKNENGQSESVSKPEIKEIDQQTFKEKIPEVQMQKTEETIKANSEKQEWF